MFRQFLLMNLSFVQRLFWGAAMKTGNKTSFTDDFAVTYKQTYGCDFLESLRNVYGNFRKENIHQTLLVP